MTEYALTPKPSPSGGSKGVSKWKIVVFGQCLSFMLASVWATQSTLFLTCNWNAPAFSCSWVYFLMSLNLIPLVMKQRRRGSTLMTSSLTNATTSVDDDAGDDDDTNTKMTTITDAAAAAVAEAAPSTPPKYTFLHTIPLQSSVWVYCGMAILLFYGNYLSLVAIRYTTITSISMIDAVSIPTVMILSRCCLHRKYVKWHVLAAMVCMTGIFINLGVDLWSNKEEDEDRFSDGSKEYPNKIVGDVCALSAGVMFGINDVLTESTVRKNKGMAEYLGMIGFFGTFIAIFQMCITERAAIVSIFQGTTGCAPLATAGLLIVFVLGEVSRKMGNAYFLQLSEAALLQMSLLTSDVYTAIFSIIYQGILPHGLFWFASALVVSGILVYELGPSPIVKEGDRDEADEMHGIINADAAVMVTKADVV